MMSIVVEGAYKNSPIFSKKGEIYVEERKGFKKIKHYLNRSNIQSYQDLGNESHLAGSVVKGTIGAAIAGPIGFAIGVMNHSKHKVLVNWNDGQKSILEMDATEYNQFIISM